MSESFYALSAELVPLERALEAQGGVADDLQLVERVTELLGKVQEKVDRYGEFAEDLQLAIDAMKAKEERLYERRKVFENKLERLKKAAKDSMELRGIAKVEGLEYTISVQKNGGRPAVKLKAPVDKIPLQYIVNIPKADTEAIRADLIAGKPEALAIAELVEPGTSVRIR